MRSHIDEAIVTIASDFNMSPDKAKELSEIGADMTFSMSLETVVPLLGKVISDEPALKEFIVSMLKLGAIKYNYDLGSESDEDEE